MSYRLFETLNHAATYAKFRPSPPKDLIANVIRYLCEGGLQRGTDGKFEKAVDVGCGSGQCTNLLATYFNHVHAFDLSQVQIGEAIKSNTYPNVKYEVCPAENLPLNSGTVSLVTACQSYHWFDSNRFFRECSRLLVPNGVLALIGYVIPVAYFPDNLTDLRLKELIDSVYKNPVLSPHWTVKERDLVDTCYRDVVLPYSMIVRNENIVTVRAITAKELLGYFTSWSSYQQLLEQQPTDARDFMDNIESSLIEITGNKRLEDVDLEVHFNFYLLMGRKKENQILN